MAVVLLSITLLMFAVQKYYLERKTAATLTGKASRGRMLITDRSVRVPLTVLCSLVALFVIMMYLCVPIGACFPDVGLQVLPAHGQVGSSSYSRATGFQAFRDSFVLSLISAPITALLSMIISYLVVKRKFKSKGFIEAVSMLAMAVPGTVLGVGYIRGFSGGLFHRLHAGALRHGAHPHHRLCRPFSSDRHAKRYLPRCGRSTSPSRNPPTTWAPIASGSS